MNQGGRREEKKHDKAYNFILCLLDYFFEKGKADTAMLSGG